jgi:hypothetical protein
MNLETAVEEDDEEENDQPHVWKKLKGLLYVKNITCIHF